MQSNDGAYRTLASYSAIAARKAAPYASAFFSPMPGTSSSSSRVGGWWGGHVDEPLPTAVPDPDKPARPLSKQARRQDQSGLQQDDGR